jgi:hypothetical protein
MAINASMLAVAFGATVARVSEATSGSEKPLELVRLVLEDGVPSVVPFGP